MTTCETCGVNELNDSTIRERATERVQCDACYAESYADAHAQSDEPLDYLFNFSFTRPDENDATVYEVGMHVRALTFADAQHKLRERNAHLTLRDVTLYAVLDEDGNFIETGDDYVARDGKTYTGGLADQKRAEDRNDARADRVAKLSTEYPEMTVAQLEELDLTLDGRTDRPRISLEARHAAARRRAPNYATRVELADATLAVGLEAVRENKARIAADRIATLSTLYPELTVEQLEALDAVAFVMAVRS